MSSSSPSWSSINRRMRSLDLKLKNENDSNQRCSLDKLILETNPDQKSSQVSSATVEPLSLKTSLLSSSGASQSSTSTADYAAVNEETESLQIDDSNQLINANFLSKSKVTNEPQTKTDVRTNQVPPLRPTNLPIASKSHSTRMPTEISRTLSASGSTPSNRSMPHRSTSKEPKSAPTPTTNSSLNFTLNQSLRSTYSSFIDRISARINGSFNFTNQRPVQSSNVSNSTASTSDKDFASSPLSSSTPRPITLRSNSAKINGSNANLEADLNTKNDDDVIANSNQASRPSSLSPALSSPLSLTVNAQCLSPRPRPKALPISFTNKRNHSPSRSPKPLQPLIFSPNNRSTRLDTSIGAKKDNNTTLRDKFRLNNNVLTIGQKKYVCQESDFRYVEELGSGSCGHVAKMEHIPSKSIIAVKQMRRSGDDEESKRIIMDLDVLLKCYDCEHIVQCYGYLIKDTEVWIFMELMATCFDKMLRKLGRPFPEPVCGKIAVASVKALNYLKDEHSVIHRDVKPSNILINHKGIVKLCDFGISGRLVNSKAKTRQAGCAAYMAPERIDPPDPSKPSYDIRADVWSLGISLVELAIGRFPYPECKTDFEVLSKIIQNEPPFLPEDGTFSPDFCSFIKACLQKDYSKRLKYHQLLCHPFILKYEREQVDMEKWFWDSYNGKS